VSKQAMKTALEAAYLAGFNASGEGYNGEYPFGDLCKHPEDHSVWCKDRDNALEQVLAEQHLQDLHDENVHLDLYEQSEPVAWMDVDEKGAASGLRYWSEPDNRHEVALYTTPPQSEACCLSYIKV